jgi:8-oxo-dGTP diphosphatase
LITVTAAIIEKDGLIFAARRKATKHLGGLWEFPGGKIELDETPEGCLARELTEEFGIEVQVGLFFGESIYDYGEKTIRLLAFHVEHVGGDFMLNDHDELRWLAIDELDEVEWAPADIPLLEKVKSVLSEKKAKSIF